MAALATAFAVPSLSTAVDMGRCSAELAAQDTVLLTHCHSDHVAGLVAWLSAHTRRHRGRPTRVVVPAQRRSQLLAALSVWPDLDGVRRRVDLEQVMSPALPGTVVDLADGATATAFRTRHNTASLGWTLRTGSGTRPWGVIAGDGTVEPFRAEPALLDACVAVVDCSFVEPGTRVAARLGGHGHLADWLELLPDLACDALVLAHLPPETTAAAIFARIPDELPVQALEHERRRPHILPPMSRPLEPLTPAPARHLLTASAVASGLAALVLELQWGRQLALTFGTSQNAVTAVLAAFMIGLGLGSLVGGRVADRLRRPALAIAGIELVLAVPRGCPTSPTPKARSSPSRGWRSRSDC